jgi:large subunit ribosomal protein L23
MSSTFGRIGKGFRMFMPNMPIVMTSAKDRTFHQPARATFRVLPKMTKHEITEYLTKIYNLPVVKVNTINYLGKWKRVQGHRKVISFKYKDFKKAYVSFDRTLKSVGLGTRISDMEDDDTNPRSYDDASFRATPMQLRADNNEK